MFGFLISLFLSQSLFFSLCQRDPGVCSTDGVLMVVGSALALILAGTNGQLRAKVVQ